jgi:hypothetical protein
LKRLGSRPDPDFGEPCDEDSSLLPSGVCGSPQFEIPIISLLARYHGNHQSRVANLFNFGVRREQLKHNEIRGFRGGDNAQ